MSEIIVSKYLVWGNLQFSTNILIVEVALCLYLNSLFGGVLTVALWVCWCSGGMEVLF